jgi:hypothetical protein
MAAGILIVLMLGVVDNASGEFPTLFIVALILTMIVGVICYLIAFVGFCLCLCVPAETGAKGLIRTAVAARVVDLLVGVSIVAAMAATGVPVGANPIILVAQLAIAILGMVGFFCFLAFLKKVAQFVRREDLANFAGRVTSAFVTLIVVDAIMIGIVIIAVQLSDGDARGVGAMGLIVWLLLSVVLLIVFVIAFCMFTTLLRNTISAVGKCIASAPTVKSVKKRSVPSLAPDEFGST